MTLIVPNLYPWDIDPRWTDVWLAERRFVDSLNVSAWRPQKGNIILTQPTAGAKPVWSAGYGSRGSGMITGDGVDDFLIGDALAAKVSNTHAFTMIASFRARSIVHGMTIWGFGASFVLAQINLLQAFKSSPTNPFLWRMSYYDNSGTIRISDSDYEANTTDRVVLAVTMNVGIPASFSFWVNNVSRAVNVVTIPGTPGAIGDADFTKFTVLAVREGGTTSQYIACDLRALAFAPFTLSSTDISAAARLLVADAA